MADSVTKKGKKHRKHGRNKVKCSNYRSKGRREANKAKKLKKHLKRHPNDEQSRVRL